MTKVTREDIDGAALSALEWAKVAAQQADQGLHEEARSSVEISQAFSMVGQAYFTQQIAMRIVGLRHWPPPE